MSYNYEGKELELFREAVNWKQYFASKLKPYINGEVIEVGAGLGETTSYLINDKVVSWTLLEPDASFCVQLQEKLKSGALPSFCSVLNGTLEQVPAGKKFDTVLYIDVLEHIEADDAELERASRLLKPGGRIIVLSPAFPFLYSPFDRAIGHWRRYTKKTLRSLVPTHSSLREERFFYLESAGMVLLMVNKIFARSSYPSLGQVRLWDRWVVPVSRLADRLLSPVAGKTIIGIWNKR